MSAISQVTTPPYNPSQRYPRPRRVMPAELGHRKSDYPLSLYSAPTIARSSASGSGSNGIDNSSGKSIPAKSRLQASLSSSDISSSTSPLLRQPNTEHYGIDAPRELYSTPSVAKSRITASTSANDISRPRKFLFFQNYASSPVIRAGNANWQPYF